MTFGYFSSQKSNAPPAGVQAVTYLVTDPRQRQMHFQKQKEPPHGRLFQVFLMKLLPHLGQEMLILPLPRGTRSFCLQVGQLNTL